MHLFALFIAAAFSSQFVSVNEVTAVFKANTESIYKKNEKLAITIEIEKLAIPSDWAKNTPIFYVVSKNSAYTGASTPADPDVRASANAHADGKVNVVLTAVQMAALAAVQGDAIYIYAGLTNEVTALGNGWAAVAIIPDFTPDRKVLRKTKVTAGDDCPITLTEEGTVTWTATPFVVVTKNEEGTDGKDYALTGQTLGKAIIKIVQADWTTIGIISETTLYFFVGTNATAARASPGYAVDIVEDMFAITPETIAQDAVKIKSLVITPTDPITPDNNKVQFLLSKTEIFDLGAVSTGWQDATKIADTDTYGKTNVAVDDMDLAKDEIIYVYGKYTVTTRANGAETTYIPHSQEIVVGDNLFTVTPPSIARGVLTIATITITTTAEDWSNPIEVTFSKSATSRGAGDIIGAAQTAPETPAKNYTTATPVTLPITPEWLANPKIFVHVGVNVSNTYVYDDPPVEIIVNPEWTVSSGAIVQAATAITTLEVTPATPLVHADAQKKEITLHFAVNAAADRTKIPAEHTAVVTKGNGAAYTQASWTIPATLKLMKGMPLYVFASYDKSAGSNALTWLEPALTLAVGGTDVLEYAVEPRSVAVGAQTLADFKIVPKKPEYWTTETIAIKITDDTAESNFELPGTVKKHATLNEWAPTAPISLSAVTLNVAKPLKVHVSMTAATSFLPVVDTITVTPPPAAFTVEPATVDVKKSAEFTSIKLTEKATTKTWDKVWVVVSKTAGLQAVDPTKDVEKTDQTATAGVVTIALETADITKLGKLDAPTTLYVYAAKASTAAALAATPATIAFENVISFTIAPKEMVWAENLTTPEITITPNDATLFPQAATTDFIAKFTKGTGATAVSVDKQVTVTGTTTKTYKIPATDLATLTIAKPTASETLKVSLHQTAGEIGTAVDFKINKPGGGGEAAMGVSPLLSLLAAALLLLIKLF